MISGPDFDDAIAELVNIGVGRAAASLSSMVHEHIELTVPTLLAIRHDQLLDHLDMEGGTQLSLVQQRFEGKVGGTASILFPVQSARRLVSLLTHGAISAEELDLEREAALLEVGNILLNGVMGTIGNITGVDFHYRLPEYQECSSVQVGRAFGSQNLLLAMVVIAIASLQIKGHLILLFDLPSLDHLSTAIEAISRPPV